MQYYSPHLTDKQTAPFSKGVLKSPVRTDSKYTGELGCESALSEARVSPLGPSVLLDWPLPTWVSVSLQGAEEVGLGNLKVSHKVKMDAEDLLLRFRNPFMVMSPRTSCSVFLSPSFYTDDMEDTLLT